jgi:hypothetical protein
MFQNVGTVLANVCIFPPAMQMDHYRGMPEEILLLENARNKIMFQNVGTVLANVCIFPPAMQMDHYRGMPEEILLLENARNVIWLHWSVP